ncbi:MAG: hypothetical protein RL110_903, partial [Bacteroidota bacterium]
RELSIGYVHVGIEFPGLANARGHGICRPREFDKIMFSLGAALRYDSTGSSLATQDRHPMKIPSAQTTSSFPPGLR